MVGDDLTVLITDDHDGCRELYEHWLAGDHDVLTAADGEAALATLSEDVDVVLLDRDMPGPEGTVVARSIERSRFDPYVVIVSSMPMDFDVVDMPIDGYVRKPIDEADLQGIVEEYRSQQAYETALDEFFALTAKLAAIEADHAREDLTGDDRYERLRRQVEQKRAEVDEALDDSRTDWTTAFRTFHERPGQRAPCR